MITSGVLSSKVHHNVSHNINVEGSPVRTLSLPDLITTNPASVASSSTINTRRVSQRPLYTLQRVNLIGCGFERQFRRKLIEQYPVLANLPDCIAECGKSTGLTT